MATLEDIAKELGISKSTVSKALNGARDVSKNMRQAVLEKSVELGYSRPTRGDALPRIALFITNMEHTRPEDFGHDLVVGFRKAAEPAGFQVEIIPLDIPTQEANRYDEYMISGGYCGGFFLGLALRDPWIKEFQTCRTPTVLYDNQVPGNSNVTYVAVDSVEGIGLAVRHLQSLGHRKIGYLSYALGAHVYLQRYRSFFRAMKENGLTADPELTGATFHVSDCLNQHLPRLLERGCTAIVCSNDILASSVMVHCSELGLRVPEDISVIGFDDITMSQYTQPPLTTIRQDRSSLGKSAFYALSCQLNRIHLSSYLLHAELICRSSCAPAGRT